MSGTIESPIEVAPCGCDENVQLRQRNNSLQEQLQYLTEAVDKNLTEFISLMEENNSLQDRLRYLTGVMDENENELMFFMKQNEILRQKNDDLEADNKNLRQEVEILEGSHQLQSDSMDSSFIYSSEPFGKDEPTEKKEISDAEVQTEDFGHLEDGCTVDTTIESATQKIAIVSEPLGVQLEAKKALQNRYDRVKAYQQKFLHRELRYKQEIEELEDFYRKAVEIQNEKRRDERQNQRLVIFGSNRIWDQTSRSLADSLVEAIAKQILDVQKKQEPRICGHFKAFLVSFLVTFIIVFFASRVSISIDSTDPNTLYNRRQYV